MAAGGSKKLSHGVVALSATAIAAVYAAGFLRTKAAAAKMDAADLGRRPALPAPAEAGSVASPEPIEPPADFTPAPTTVSVPVVTIPTTPTPTPGAAPATAPVTDAAPVSTPASATTTTELVAAAVATETAAIAAPPEPAAPPAPVPPPPLMPKEHYKDGVYTGWGTSRHGDIQASVTIEGGRITATSIAQCRTRYSCSWVAHLPAQIVARQSPECDYVSGATQSANAFYWAVVDALGKAKQSSANEQR